MLHVVKKKSLHDLSVISLWSKLLYSQAALAVQLPSLKDTVTVPRYIYFIDGYLKNERLLISFDSTIKIAMPNMVGNNIQI